jgi:CheY-like chemotaxis protein
MSALTTGLILIVDDSPNNLDVISETLTDAGLEVATALTGERALEQVKYSEPDLILLDVMMPGIDGFETCQRLKADPKTCNIPVIFMTALTDAESKVRGFSLGAVDYV